MRMILHDGTIVPLLAPYSFNPTMEQIAFGLSNKFRYSGQSRFTVAQHSVLVCDLLPAPLRFSGLMHDAHEVFTGDVSTPHKELFRHFSDFYDRFEYEWASRVRQFFQLPVTLHDDVKKADKRAYQIEIANLFPERAVSSFISLNYHPEYGYPLQVWSPDESRIKFLEKASQYSQWVTM